LRALTVGLLVCALAGCGDDAGEGDAGELPDGAIAAGDAGSGPIDVAPNRAGWETAFDTVSQSGFCDGTLESLEGLTSLPLEDGRTAYVGYAQVSDANQNPILAVYDGDTRVFCVQNENGTQDGRAHGIVWDGGDTAYVLFTIDNRGSDLEGLGGHLDTFTPEAITGVGGRIMVVGQVRMTTGAVENATFLPAADDGDRLDSHLPTGLAFTAQGFVEVSGVSTSRPLDTTGDAAMTCTPGTHYTRYRFAADLLTVECADVTGCASSGPCAR
jgi:hypothetical protein